MADHLRRVTEDAAHLARGLRAPRLGARSVDRSGSDDGLWLDGSGSPSASHPITGAVGTRWSVSPDAEVAQSATALESLALALGSSGYGSTRRRLRHGPLFGTGTLSDGVSLLGGGDTYTADAEAGERNTYGRGGSGGVIKSGGGEKGGRGDRGGRGGEEGSSAGFLGTPEVSHLTAADRSAAHSQSALAKTFLKAAAEIRIAAAEVGHVLEAALSKALYPIY